MIAPPLLLVAALVFPHAESGARAAIPFVPLPTIVEMREGTCPVEVGLWIVPADARLAPVAGALAEELRGAFGVLAVWWTDRTPPRPGDVELVLDPELVEDECAVEVSERVVVRGGSPAAVARGTAFLLQAIDATQTPLTLPRFRLHDRPPYAYRGLLVDVARRPHSIDVLRQLVVLCRLYGIRYLQLHLTDDQAFTFPSESFPALATPGHSFSLPELRDLVAFADARGVTLVPEIDVPGHSTAMRRAMPALFDSVDPATGAMRDLGVLNLGSEAVAEAMDRIVGDLCDVFRSSPFVHVGADETWLGNLGRAPETAAALAKKGFDDLHDLLLDFVVRMHESVKRRGKQTLVWESFAGTGSARVSIPRDVIVMAWETAYQEPRSLLANGYRVINASWKPLYVTPWARFPVEAIHGWHPLRWENWAPFAPSYVPIEVEPTDRVLGAQLCSWEMDEAMQVADLRRRLAAFADRMASPRAEPEPADFARRLAAADDLVQRLLFGVHVEAEGLDEAAAEGASPGRENAFAGELVLRLRPSVEGRVVLYTFDGSEPDERSRVATKPIRLTDTTTISVAVLGVRRQRVGSTLRIRYEHHPVRARIEGLLEHLPHDRAWEPRTVFGNEARVELSCATKGAIVRYTLDGSAPCPGTPVATAPIVLRASATVRARAFDAEGRPRGEEWRRDLRRVDFERNLTTGRPATTSDRVDAGHPPAAAVDGAVDLERFWDASSGPPQWLQVDLGDPHTLRRVHLFPYWDGTRAYRYRVEVSLDGAAWTEIVDASGNTAVATEAGHAHDVAAAPARFVRATMLGNTANRGVHLVELRVYE